MRHTGKLILLTAITLATLWPGAAQATKWSLQSAAIPTGAKSSGLKSVSCPAKACMAVGDYHGTGGVLPFADEEEGGSWTVRSMANPTGATATFAVGVSCSSYTACTAVGTTNSATVGPVFAERWNGTSWTLQSAVNPSTEGGSLNSVSCIRTTECYAVGFDVEAAKVVTLAEYWDGTEWLLQKTPNPKGSEWAGLESVSCTYAALPTCTAVGIEIVGGATKMLAERFNGHEWSILSTTSPTGSTSTELFGVSCYAANECLAVGRYEAPASSKTLVEPLGAFLAEPEKSANSSKAYTDLQGVSCPTSEGCLPVGAAGPSPEEPFSEHLEAGEYVSIATPSEPSSGANDLESVSCRAVAECVAVGHYFSTSGEEEKPLAEGY